MISRSELVDRNARQADAIVKLGNEIQMLKQENQQLQQKPVHQLSITAGSFFDPYYNSQRPNFLTLTYNDRLRAEQALSLLESDVRSMKTYITVEDADKKIVFKKDDFERATLTFNYVKS